MIEIFSEDGSVRKYRPLSERLPEFLAAFPFTEGYRISVEAKALAEICPGADAGGVVFTASLYKGDAVVANASAHRFRLSQFKDWEKGETAARQRLLAACGFGGDVLDEDEAADLSDQGVKFQPSAPTPKAEAPAAKTPTKARAKAEVKVEETKPAAQAPVEAPAEEKAEAAPADQPALIEEPADIPPAILRQIEHQARLRGVPVPHPTNLDEAREALKGLMRR